MTVFDLPSLDADPYGSKILLGAVLRVRAVLSGRFIALPSLSLSISSLCIIVEGQIISRRLSISLVQ